MMAATVVHIRVVLVRSLNTFSKADFATENLSFCHSAYASVQGETPEARS